MSRPDWAPPKTAPGFTVYWAPPAKATLPEVLFYCFEDMGPTLEQCEQAVAEYDRDPEVAYQKMLWLRSRLKELTSL